MSERRGRVVRVAALTALALLMAGAAVAAGTVNRLALSVRVDRAPGGLPHRAQAATLVLAAATDTADGTQPTALSRLDLRLPGGVRFNAGRLTGCTALRLQDRGPRGCSVIGHGSLRLQITAAGDSGSTFQTVRLRLFNGPLGRDIEALVDAGDLSSRRLVIEAPVRKVPGTGQRIVVPVLRIPDAYVTIRLVRLVLGRRVISASACRSPAGRRFGAFADYYDGQRLSASTIASCP
jgi:hypothetical protein